MNIISFPFFNLFLQRPFSCCHRGKREKSGKGKYQSQHCVTRPERLRRRLVSSPAHPKLRPTPAHSMNITIQMYLSIKKTGIPAFICQSKNVRLKRSPIYSYLHCVTPSLSIVLLVTQLSQLKMVSRDHFRALALLSAFLGFSESFLARLGRISSV